MKCMALVSKSFCKRLQRRIRVMRARIYIGICVAKQDENWAIKSKIGNYSYQ